MVTFSHSIDLHVMPFGLKGSGGADGVYDYKMYVFLVLSHGLFVEAMLYVTLQHHSAER